MHAEFRQKTVSLAYKRLMSDPISAFGGVLIANTEIDFETAKLLKNYFLSANSTKIQRKSFGVIKRKKNLIILKNNIKEKKF